MFGSPVNDLLGSFTAPCTGRMSCGLWKLRGNVLECRAVSSRGGRGETDCRYPDCVGIETLAHLTSVCPALHGQRVRRHDRAVERIETTACRALGAENVRKEPRILRTDGVAPHAKPDLVLSLPDRVIVADVSVAWERGDVLTRRFDEKAAKYRQIEAVGSWAAREFPGKPVEFAGISLGVRGSIEARSLGILKDVGFSRREAGHLLLGVMEDSVGAVWIFPSLV